MFLVISLLVIAFFTAIGVLMVAASNRMPGSSRAFIVAFNTLSIVVECLAAIALM